MTNSIPEKFAEFIRKQEIINGENEKLISFAAKITKLNIAALINRFAGEEKYFYWKQTDNKTELLAINPVKNFRSNGINRTIETEKQIKAYNPVYYSNHSEFPGVSFPLFTGGLKFAPDQKEILWNDYEDSDWFLPEYLVFKYNNEYYFLKNILAAEINVDFEKSKIQDFFSKLKNLNGSTDIISPSIINSVNVIGDEEETKSEWVANVSSILQSIKESGLRKVVLSREVTIEVEGNVSFSHVVDRLSRSYPDCYIFIFKSGDSIFFGASPERLAKFSGGWIESDALAGSTARGKTEEEDKQLADELLASHKNLSEQQAVVEFIASSFANFSDEIVYPASPSVKKLPNIQHLWTPVKAKLTREKTIFKIIQDIHPTPAICGTPWMEALNKIKELEKFERGLFAGAIGWFNFDCEGEFAVAIRSGLFKNNKIYAFAGCGIVDGSNPLVEYNEANLKLRPVLSLFKNEKISQP